MPVSNAWPDSIGASVRPSRFVVAAATRRRSAPLMKCSSTAMPCAGRPREVSRTWVVRDGIASRLHHQITSSPNHNLQIFSSEPESQTSVRRAGVGIDAKFLTSLSYCVPRPIVGFEADLGDCLDISQDPCSHLVNHL